jgi:hypothetical protein
VFDRRTEFPVGALAQIFLVVLRARGRTAGGAASCPGLGAWVGEWWVRYFATLTIFSVVLCWGSLRSSSFLLGSSLTRGKSLRVQSPRSRPSAKKGMLDFCLARSECLLESDDETRPPGYFDVLSCPHGAASRRQTRPETISKSFPLKLSDHD